MFRVIQTGVYRDSDGDYTPQTRGDIIGPPNYSVGDLQFYLAQGMLTLEPPSSSGGGGSSDASAANQTTEIARLTSILSSVQLAATEATLAAIILELEEMRVLLDYPKNTSYQQGNSYTPNDTIGIGTLFEAISVNFDGNVKMQLIGGTEPFTVYLRAGVVYPLKVEKVFATGTTATGITVWR